MDYREWMKKKENKEFINSIDKMNDAEKTIASKKFLDMLKVIEAIKTFTLNGEGMSLRLMDLLEGVHSQATGNRADAMTWIKQAVDNATAIQTVIGEQENEVRALTAFILVAGVFRGFPVEILNDVEEEAEPVLTYMDIL